MDEDTALATICLIVLGISTIICCLAAWFRYRYREDENGFVSVV
jgi:hypothetical protein